MSRATRLNSGVRQTDATATFAPAWAAKLGNRFVFLGDSVTIGSDDVTNNVNGSSWPTWAALLSNQKVHGVRNAGVAGNTSAQMLARFDTDVTPYSPNVVTVLAGTNDTGQSVPLATFQSNIRAIVGKIRAIGATPVLATMPPNNTGTPANRKQQIITFNNWLRRYAESIGVHLLDFYGLLVDPANGNYLAAYYNDGTHPNPAGYFALGQYAANVLAPLVPTLTPPLTQDANDPDNLLANGLFLTDANADGIADGWGTYGGTTNVTRTLVADSAIKGQWQQVAITGGALAGVTRNLSAGWAVGDRILIAGLVAQPTPGSLTGGLYAAGTPNTYITKPFQALAQTFASGVFCTEATVPAGTTSLSLDLLCSGNGTVKFAQITAYNLTQQGILAP